MTHAAPELARDPLRPLSDAIREVDPQASRVVTGELPSELDAFSVLSSWSGDAIFWHDGDGESVGLGVHARIDASGPGRFHEVAVEAARVFEDSFEESERLRFYCGFAFDHAVRGTRWRSFEAGSAVLPRLLLQRSDRSSAWSVTIPVSSDTDFDELGAIIELLRGPVGEPPPLDTVEAGRRASADFRALVRDAKGRISRGHAAKIVAARRLDLELEGPVDLGSIARALDAQNPACHRFVFRRADATFFGASPERLIQRLAGEVSTVALAGSAAPEDAQVLLESIKDRDEHEHVVRHLRESLGPFCDRLAVDEGPSLRPLNHVVHLETGFKGTLREPVHVLRLAAALHPTPAVGGVPTEFARGWIRELEGADRGWYAGPVGWFDGRGDGSLAVAIRSALVRGRDVALWSGAGIVAESDPDSETEEAERKLRPILAAFGLT